jgi:hypothetical protein
MSRMFHWKFGLQLTLPLVILFRTEIVQFLWLNEHIIFYFVWAMHIHQILYSLIQFL